MSIFEVIDPRVGSLNSEDRIIVVHLSVAYMMRSDRIGAMISYTLLTSVI